MQRQVEESKNSVPARTRGGEEGEEEGDNLIANQNGFLGGDGGDGVVSTHLVDMKHKQQNPRTRTLSRVSEKGGDRQKTRHVSKLPTEVPNNIL
jgi:hypothetical protein